MPLLHTTSQLIIVKKVLKPERVQDFFSLHSGFMGMLLQKTFCTGRLRFAQEGAKLAIRITARWYPG